MMGYAILIVVLFPILLLAFVALGWWAFGPRVNYAIKPGGLAPAIHKYDKRSRRKWSLTPTRGYRGR